MVVGSDEGRAFPITKQRSEPPPWSFFIETKYSFKRLPPELG
jgi:hypothetical protein